jgi:hypothetical protein
MWNPGAKLWVQLENPSNVLMPLTTGKSIGSQSTAKAGANLQWKNLIPVGNVFSPILDTPGLPKLTWIIDQTAGAMGFSVVPEIAVRRDAVVAGEAAYEFLPISAASLTVPGSPTVFEFNAPVQAIRLNITGPVGLPAGTAVTVVLLASA